MAGQAIVTFSDVAGFTGYDPEQILQSQGIDPSTAEGAAGAALALAQGGSVSFADVAPLIGLGLAATGVGAPVAGLVTGLLAGAQALAGLLSGGSPQADWYVGTVGFSGPKPYGPGDPKWVTFEEWLKQVGGGGSLLATGAFPWLPTILRDEANLGTDPASQFQRAYFAAWKRNAEMRLNGYTASPPFTLLATMAAAWNKQHAPGAGFDFTTNGAGTWSQISAVVGPRDQQTGEYISPGIVPTVPAKGWYIGALLAGAVDGQDKPPIHLNTGAAMSNSMPYPADEGGGSLAGIKPITFKVNTPKGVVLQPLKVKLPSAFGPVRGMSGQPQAAVTMGSVSPWVWIGGAGVLAGLGYLALRKRK